MHMFVPPRGPCTVKVAGHMPAHALASAPTSATTSSAGTVVGGVGPTLALVPFPPAVALRSAALAARPRTTIAWITALVPPLPMDVAEPTVMEVTRSDHTDV